jgi:hypothetical protein
LAKVDFPEPSSRHPPNKIQNLFGGCCIFFIIHIFIIRGILDTEYKYSKKILL